MVAIVLMAIGDYYINVYSWLFYWWLLVAILLMVICDYSIGGYFINGY